MSYYEKRQAKISRRYFDSEESEFLGAESGKLFSLTQRVHSSVKVSLHMVTSEKLKLLIIYEEKLPLTKNS